MDVFVELVDHEAICVARGFPEACTANWFQHPFRNAKCTKSLKECLALLQFAKSQGVSACDADVARLIFSTQENKGQDANWTEIGTRALRQCVMPHQREAVRRVTTELGGRAILALPTGTGKSLVCCALAAHYGGNVLVVASAQQQWADEFATWTSFPPADLINGNRGNVQLDGVAVATYKSVTMREDVRSAKWKTIIVDESHKLGGQCAMNATIVKMCERARCVVLVSATPMKGKPKELFNTLRCLHPKAFTNRRAFEARYCDGKIGRFGYEALGATHMEELSAVVDRCIVRCDKEIALPDLPPITFHDVRFPVSSIVKNEFDDMKRKYKELSDQASSAPAYARERIKLERDALSMRMYVRTGEVKVGSCVDWLLAYLKDHPEDKILVFAHHASVMTETCAALKDVPHAKIDGTTPAGKRHEILRSMRDPLDSSMRVAVLSLGTSAESLNLVGANVVVMFQLSFTPAQNDQAYARAWRKGATRPVSVYRLIADDTHDDAILRIHEHKRRVASRVFNE